MPNRSHQELLPLDWVYLIIKVAFLVTSHADADGTFYSISCHLPRNCSFISLSPVSIHCAWGTFYSNQSLVFLQKIGIIY